MEARTTGRGLLCLFLYATISSQFRDGLQLNFLFLKGGSFLYVATVLQPVSSGGTTGLPHEDDINAKTRLVFIVLGMFAPLFLSTLVGHGHS